VPWPQDAEETRAALPKGLDWLILDHYAFDHAWEAAVLPDGARLMVIDDLADRAHRCDLLLDQNLGRRAEDYDPLVPATAARLIGPRHALLRPEFAAAREEALAARAARGGRLDHVLVTMGGVDADNATGAVLATPALRGLRVTAVLGPAAPHLAAVQAQAAALPGVEVVSNVANMAPLMAAADLAIGATGGTAWERCCLGLPTLMLVLAENQAPAAAALQAVGAGVGLGRMGAPDLSARLDTSLVAAADPASLARMSAAAAAVTDGRGAARVVAALEAPPLRLRPATMADAEMVWHWRQNLPPEQFRAGPTPDLGAHLRWFAAALADPDRLLMMAETDSPLGHLRLDGGGAAATVSILLAPAARGQGLGLRALALLAAMAQARGIHRLEARVHPSNAASRGLFQRAGYAPTHAEAGFLGFARAL
jgi:UDP-2,4-diacetamido-2,4,6-trideoxy-beta-L-altropyranose hydrolase